MSSPRRRASGSWSPVVATACLGVLFSLAVFRVVLRLDRRANLTRFTGESQETVSLIRRTISEKLGELDSVVRFYGASQEVERTEFRDFVARYVRSRATRALAWVPRVPAPARAQMERRARADGFSGFRITGRDARGKTVPASARRDYFPVYYVEPYPGNETFLGSDLASDPELQAAMGRARDSGGPVASAPRRLRTTSGRDGGEVFLVFRAVYRNRSGIDSVAARRASLSGFVVGVFRIAELVDQAIAGTSRTVDAYLFDGPVPRKETFLDIHRPRAASRKRAAAIDFSSLEDGLHSTDTVDVAGRTWLVLTRPVPGAGGSAPVVWPWIFLTMGFLGTAGLSAHLVKRRQMEEALVEREREFRATFEQAAVGIVHVAPDGRYLRVNERFCDIVGYAREELIGRPFHDVPRSLDEGRAADRFRTLLTGEVPVFSSEERLVRRGGSTLIANLTVGAARGPGGEVRYLIAAVEDITARRQTEEEYGAFLRAATDGFWIVDAEGTLREVNDAACVLSGYGRDELVGKNVRDLEIAEDGEDPGARWAGIRRSGTGRYEARHRKRDGGTADVEMSVRYLEGFGGRFFAFVRDIGARKRAEEERTRLTMAVEQAAEAIVITDSGGTIRYVNPAFEKITGYAREEAVGQNPRILKSGIQDEAFYRELWDTLNRGDVWKGTFENRRKDGAVYAQEAVISPVRDAGGIVDYVAVARDVTSAREMDRQIQTVQRMESVGMLAGGIAHDFNNMLTAILGFGEILRTQVAADRDAASNLDEILRTAERASALTKQLLTFARRQVIEPSTLDLNVVVSDMMKLVRKVIGSHIDIRTVLGADLPAVRTDHGQMEQVLMNLCLNARDAMPGGGRLVVTTEETVLEEEEVRQHPYMRSGRYVLLSVSDAGTGMDEATRLRAFEPFFTTKEPGKGTGLGLSVVYGIVKQNGGFIHLHSEPGEGTTFKIYLPAVMSRPGRPRGAETAPVRGGAETILLAEDEEMVRTLAERVLQELDYTVLVACNGEEALDLFRKNAARIDLAFLDVVMPRKGGRDAYEEMRRERPDLKAVFTSGYNVDAVHESFVLIPGVPLLPKPYGPASLARKIREVLDRK